MQVRAFERYIPLKKSILKILLIFRGMRLFDTIVVGSGDSI